MWLKYLHGICEHPVPVYQFKKIPLLPLPLEYIYILQGEGGGGFFLIDARE